MASSPPDATAVTVSVAPLPRRPEGRFGASREGKPVYYRPVRARESTQPSIRPLALAISLAEKKSSALTLSTG